MADREPGFPMHPVPAVPTPAPPHDSDATLVGRIIDLSGHTWLGGSDVVLVGTTVDGQKVRYATTPADDGTFELEVPPDVRFWKATVITSLSGTDPVPLDLHKGVIEPGEIVIVVNEPGPFHVRYGLA